MRFIPGFLLFCAIALTAACNGESAIKDTRNKPNSFAGVNNPADDFSPGSTGDSNNSNGLSAGEVRVTLELPGNLAPDGEPTRRNLRIAQPDSVRVYQINRNLQEIGSIIYSTRKDAEGYTVIRFENGQPMSPDVVIEARYGHITLRSLAADADRDIKINPFSEFLLRNTLPNYTTGEFQRLLDCANNTSGALCLNKLVWPALADQIHDFEIDIPTGASIASALDFLSQRADLVSYIDSAADYPLLDVQSVDDISASSADYNSVFMGMELGQTFLESSSAGSGQWGVRSGREEATSSTTYRYPGSTLTSLDFIGIKTTSLAAQIPYDRKTLIHQDGNTFYARGPELWDLNTHSSSPGAATIDSDNRMLSLRALYQSITGRGSSRTVGWTRNPYYLDAYVGAPAGTNTGPDRTLAGYFSAGKAIRLETEQGKLARKDELEAHYVSALGLNLLRKEGFDANTLNNRDYNMIYFATRFSEGSASPMQIETGAGSWEVRAGSEGSTITQTQDYSTLSRDSSGGVTTGSTNSRSDNWALNSRVARLSSGDKHIGRLNLYVNKPVGLFGQPDLGVGASVPDGSLMAFNLVDAAPSGGAIIGDGLLIAAEKAADAPTTGSYRVQGFIVGLEDGFNKLIHLDNGTLNLPSPSEPEVSLSSKTFEVLHSVNAETVSTPASVQLTTPGLTYTHMGDGKVSFSDGDLSLTGFVTADHSQFFLLYQDQVNGESRRGLLLATKVP